MDLQRIQDYIGWGAVAAIVVGINLFMIKLIWLGVRSLMKKTINLPPSRWKWARMRAEVIEDEDTGDRSVRYFYDYREYTARIGGFSVYGDKAMIYVKRRDPSVVKEFIPQPPMTVAAAVSCLFIAAMILFFEAVLIFG